MASPAGPDRRAPGQSPGPLSRGSCRRATWGRGPGDASRLAPGDARHAPAAALSSPAVCGGAPASPPCRGCQVGRAGRTRGQEHRGLAKFRPDTCAVGAGTLTQARDHGRCEAAVRHFLFWATAAQSGLGWTPLGPSHGHLTHSQDTPVRTQAGSSVAGSSSVPF